MGHHRSPNRTGKSCSGLEASRERTDADPDPDPNRNLPGNTTTNPQNTLRNGEKLEIMSKSDSDASPSLCQEAVLEYFPNICPDYLMVVGRENGWDAQKVITTLVDQLDAGNPYPKRARRMKRKRDDANYYEGIGYVNRDIPGHREEAVHDGYLVTYRKTA